MKKTIPEISLQRLPIYLNYLRTLSGEEYTHISSGAIAKALDMGEVLVRKDLAFTSATGRPKVGYLRSELIAALEDYLCCNDHKNAILVGVGGLGRALLGYGGFSNYGIEIAAAFDNDEQKIGTDIAGKPILSVNELEDSVKKYNALMAIVCVPASVAQQVCDTLVGAGVKSILNFAPVLLKVPEEVNVRHLDVAANLAVLASL